MNKKILKEYWGYDNFRGIQEKIIESIEAGRDTLGLMPTGGGKSITFQVPALVMEGVCIVITPLISLMKDQVDNLQRRGIRAYAIHSSLTRDEIVTILDNCIYGGAKLLYVSPERLSSPLFLQKLKHINISFICVDEAHCISQWGYDFRPSYLHIKEIRKELEGKPVLALTATATKAVADDIQDQLLFTKKNVFRMSFKRENLTYIVRHTDDVIGEALNILNKVPGTAIIYTSARRKTKDYAKILRDNGISAAHYHAGLDIAVKTKHQSEWQKGSIRVIVATNAFGMGIDKPDVRLVIHTDVPASIEAYFQEAGRAGRDGKRSYAVLLASHSTSTTLKNRIHATFPEKKVIRDIYEHLAYFFEVGVGMGAGVRFVFPIERFCYQNKYYINTVHSALHILDNAGYINYEIEEDSSSRVKFIVSRDELYKLREVTDKEDKVINAILRCHTGSFSSFVFIDENALAQYAGLEKNDVIASLIMLSRRHIIRYIPPLTDPVISYRINRVDGKDVKLRKEIYDNLRDIMIRQTNSMISYVYNDTICRQRLLLSYFGEDTPETEDCGGCDNCRKKNR